MNFIDKLGLVLISGNKVLMVKSANKDKLLLPGGKRDEGESDLEALKREVMEELGVELVEETVKLFGIFEGQAHGKPEGTMLRITAYTSEIVGEPSPNNEIIDIEWVEFNDESKITSVGSQILKKLREN